jgi:Protein of unknown function (DUF3592)
MGKKMFITERRGGSFNDRYSPRDRRAIGIAIMALAAFGFVMAAKLVYLNWQFDGPTIKVTGTVVALYPSKGRSNPNVAYSYPIGNVEQHTVTPVNEEVFDGLHVGNPLPVKYLPDNPTVTRIDLPAEDEQRQETGYVLTAMSILFVCVGAYTIGKASRDLKFGITTQKREELDFVPDPDNRKEVRARGWSRDDFKKILIDFRKIYDRCLENEIAAKIDSLKDGAILVTFPEDVPDQLFAFLINFAQYPKGFEPKPGSILVVGKAIISGKFEGRFDPKLIGREAVFYVPAGDRDFDNVYVQVGDETFAHSFALLSRWKKTADPRLPAGFADLLSIQG